MLEGDEMINDRQKQLLKLIVEEYIKTIRPVSSKSLCDALNCSSATIRSEMSFLEDIGFLEKTHTSSGRIPSEKGYRYYVDNLMVPKDLTGDDVLKLQTIVENNKLILSDSIMKSLEIISDLTDCTIISLGSSSKENIISKVEVVPITDNSMVGIIVTDKGHVENRNIVLNEKISIAEVKQTIDIINKYIVGTPLDEVNEKLEFEVKPIIGKNVNSQKKLFEMFCSFINDVAHDSNIQMAGRNNILKQPEFNDVNKIRNILAKFDDKEFIKNITSNNNDDGDEINIYIGSESSFDDDVSVIKTTYSINGEDRTIALIGPTRMEYDRVITLLNYLRDNM